MLNACAQNVCSNGTAILPPSDSVRKTRSAAAGGCAHGGTPFRPAAVAVGVLRVCAEPARPAVERSVDRRAAVHSVSAKVRALRTVAEEWREIG